MIVPGSVNPLLLQSAGSSAYQITRSLRFNAPDGSFCSRTPSVAGNRKTFTFATWVKRTNLSNESMLFSAGNATNNWAALSFASASGSIAFYQTITSLNIGLTTTPVYRDPSAWMHVVLAVDTTQATSTNRVKIYVNNTQVTAFSSATYPAQNSDTWINSTTPQYIGKLFDGAANYYCDCLLAETYFIDGQALDPSSFTTTDLTTGQLIPKAYTGSYGTNGFQLKFADNSSNTATTLGKDSAGSNNWTPNNFSVTAGAGNDSLVDTPTSYGSDTGLGSEVRGNYCTWNSTWSNPTLTNGNLDYTTTTGSTSAIGTIGVSSGKWYFEITPSTSLSVIGVAPPSTFNTEIGSTATSYGYLSNGNKFNNGSSTAYGSTYTSNDVIGVALDLDNGKIWFSKNGTWQASGNPAAGTNAAFTGISGTFAPTVSRYTSTEQSGSLNCGQRTFSNAAPSGFKAICDTSLAAPTVAKPSTVMDVLTWSGNNASPRSFTGLNFSPDFVWIKSRSDAAGHGLYDSVRLAGNVLRSMDTSAEVANSAFGYLSGFNSDGFALTAGTYPGYESGDTNMTGRTYVGWAWDAGTSTVSNTSGSITSQVRANASAGFSVVTYTGTSAASATVGHGLGVAPGLIIIKKRSGTASWPVWHSALTSSQLLVLNSTSAVSSGVSTWNSTLPTSTVFSLGADGGVWNNGDNYVAYVFSPVSGYSSFGSYTGNGSADGPFVYLGFRPKWILFRYNASPHDWRIMDTSRNTYNTANSQLYPNNSDAEITNSLHQVDYLSNGFKVVTGGTPMNTSGGTYLYAAFAESPFAYSRAR